jgi:hypothetical protein
VVSWGPGCAQPHTVGVYANVAHFESWIRGRGKEAAFYRDGGSGSAPQPQQGGGSNTAQAPSVAAIQEAADALGASDLVSVQLVEGPRATVDSAVHLKVETQIPGQLLVYNVDLVSGKAYQLFPNRYSGGEATMNVGPGSVRVVPSNTDKFRIRMKPPFGANRIYAFVLPRNVKMGDIAQRGLSMEDLPDAHEIFAEIAARAYRAPVVEAQYRDRGVAVFDYEIVR